MMDGTRVIPWISDTSSSGSRAAKKQQMQPELNQNTTPVLDLDSANASTTSIPTSYTNSSPTLTVQSVKRHNAVVHKHPIGSVSPIGQVGSPISVISVSSTSQVSPTRYLHASKTPQLSNAEANTTRCFPAATAPSSNPEVISPLDFSSSKSLHEHTQSDYIPTNNASPTTTPVQSVVTEEQVDALQSPSSTSSVSPSGTTNCEEYLGEDSDVVVGPARFSNQSEFVGLFRWTHGGSTVGWNKNLLADQDCIDYILHVCGCQICGHVMHDPVSCTINEKHVYCNDCRQTKQDCPLCNTNPQSSSTNQGTQFHSAGTEKDCIDELYVRCVIDECPETFMIRDISHHKCTAAPNANLVHCDRCNIQLPENRMTDHPCAAVRNHPIRQKLEKKSREMTAEIRDYSSRPGMDTSDGDKNKQKSKDKKQPQPSQFQKPNQSKRKNAGWSKFSKKKARVSSTASTLTTK
eukprot:m.21929 g.21929  ORF g.21929 m.21929 type:complete len:463 (-) comp13618_c0_seq1:119-1507(-)